MRSPFLSATVSDPGSTAFCARRSGKETHVTAMVSAERICDAFIGRCALLFGFDEEGNHIHDRTTVSQFTRSAAIEPDHGGRHHGKHGRHGTMPSLPCGRCVSWWPLWNS